MVYQFGRTKIGYIFYSTTNSQPFPLATGMGASDRKLRPGWKIFISGPRIVTCAGSMPNRCQSICKRTVVSCCAQLASDTIALPFFSQTVAGMSILSVVTGQEGLQ